MFVPRCLLPRRTCCVFLGIKKRLCGCRRCWAVSKNKGFFTSMQGAYPPCPRMYIDKRHFVLVQQMPGDFVLFLLHRLSPFIRRYQRSANPGRPHHPKSAGFIDRTSSGLLARRHIPGLWMCRATLAGVKTSIPWPCHRFMSPLTARSLD